MQKIVGYIAFMVAFFVTVTLWDQFFGDGIEWVYNIVITIGATIIYVALNIFMTKRRQKQENKK